MLNRKNDKPECDLESNTRRLEISSLQKAAEALRESEEKCHAIIEGIEDGYYELDLEGNFTFFIECAFRYCQGATHTTPDGKRPVQTAAGKRGDLTLTRNLRALGSHMLGLRKIFQQRPHSAGSVLQRS